MGLFRRMILMSCRTNQILHKELCKPMKLTQRNVLICQSTLEAHSCLMSEFAPWKHLW